MRQFSRCRGWSVVPFTPLVAWVLLLWLIAAARMILILQYRRATQLARLVLLAPLDVDQHHRSRCRLGRQRLFPHRRHPLHMNWCTCFVLGGMTAGAISVLSRSRCPLSLLRHAGHCPFSDTCCCSADGTFISSWGHGLPVLLATIHSAWNFNRVLMSSMRLRLEKVSLVQSLTIRTEAVERLNQDITKDPRTSHHRGPSRTAQGDLEQRIAERTTDLAQANARLQEEVREHRLTEGARLSVKRFNYLTDSLNQGCGSHVPNRRRCCT